MCEVSHGSGSLDVFVYRLFSVSLFVYLSVYVSLTNDVFFTFSQAGSFYFLSPQILNLSDRSDSRPQPC